MKIGVPTKENNQLDDHFGHCEFYTIFNISEQREIMAETILESPKGCGCKSDVASVLSELGVELMLAGGIGEGAINKLATAQIQVIRNCKGDVHELVESYLAGRIIDGGQSCSSHGHDEGHEWNH
jgi:predicted Fe-Mo cluster-binding NifX family protein